MGLKIRLSILLFAGVLFSCGTSSKTFVPTAQSKLLDELVSQRSFEIESDWASPQMTSSLNSISDAGLLPPGSAANRINLIGNSNYVRVKGDSVMVYLPYFGERQMGGGYDSDGGAIQFTGIPENYEVSQDGKRGSYDIRFNMKNKTESFEVTTTIFPNLASTIQVTSSHRFPIRYSGYAKSIPND